MESFPSSEGSFILRTLTETIRGHTEALSRLDGAIGDGDHGVNMTKGFTLAAARLADAMDLSTGLRILGETLLTEIGGVMGPLYGTFFCEMGAAGDSPEIDAHLFGAMLDAGVAGVLDVGGAHVGDKTLVDVLVPARDAYDQAIGAGAAFHLALQRMVEAADQGEESTRAMVARVGRASRLGERSRGVVDPGAASCALILSSIAASIKTCLSGEDRTTSRP